MGLGIKMGIFLFRILFPSFLFLVFINIISIIEIDKIPWYKLQVIVLVSVFVAFLTGYILQYYKSLRVMGWKLIGITTVVSFIFYFIAYLYASYAWRLY
ncbi:hypothetical protein [Bacillus sp. XF8]|uniref:hypothetical protein n=1 Tax=Bacillus sp. XF8 TaxID=2819289 RepID=UPI001AA04D5C|nr:hypothetical protein [Bacillus sp. XF8]MBO1581712.1 hypothetical protein [Bacillus sp. XF8]